MPLYGAYVCLEPVTSVVVCIVVPPDIDRDTLRAGTTLLQQMTSAESNLLWESCCENLGFYVSLTVFDYGAISM